MIPSIANQTANLAAPLRRSCSALVLAALSAAAAGAQPAADGTIDTVAGSVYGGDGGQATATQLYDPINVAVDGSGNVYIVTRTNHRIRKVDTAGIITTVAGNGRQGYGGDGGAATAAQLNLPWDVAVDGSGNLYIADSGNYRIRKVDADTGNISTVAGNGNFGFSGDGGLATEARLSIPRGVTADGSGNLYIADTFNQRIRKVDADGNISTVAGNGTFGFSGDGGSATAATLRNPWSVTADGSGNFYIADTGSNRIRKVDAAGDISTVAGNGTNGHSRDGHQATTAALFRPTSVALDGSGNLYSGSTSGRSVRKIDTATGIISTFAGSGQRGFNGDGGLATATRLYRPQGVAVDGSGNLYIAEANNQRIRKVDAATGIVSTVAGGATGDGGPATAAHLNFPRGVEADGSGNLYIADTYYYRIRKIDAAGIISTVAGNGTNGYSGDGGLATEAQLLHPVNTTADGDGNLYIADAFNHRIRKVDADTGIISTVAGIGSNGFGGDGGLATAATLHYPWDVALDGSDNLYIADRDNDRIRKVDADTEIISTVAGGGTGGDGGQATAAGLYKPQSVALDGSNNLYIAEAGTNHRIRKVDAVTGNISTVAGTGTKGFSGDGGQATAAQLNFPHSLALDRANNLYIADRGNNRIRWVNAATGIIATVAGTGTSGFSKDGGLAAQSRLYTPYGVAVDGAGYIYIGDTFSHRIRRVGPPPTEPPAPSRGSEPAAHARALELAFVLRQDSAPAAQQVVLYTENGDVDFRAQPGQRWISVEPASGSLRQDEEAAVTVTVDPAGLRVGRREGLVYVRSGGRVTARVRIALTVRPAAGPAVSRHGVVNAAVLSAFGERGLFGSRLLPVAPGSLVLVRGENFTGGEAYAAQGFPLPTSLGGVTVQFDGLEAPLFAVGPQRIEAQLPSLLGGEALAAGGTVWTTVVVETAEGGSYPLRLLAGSHGPGIFTMSGGGTGQAAAVLAGTTVLAAPSGFSGNIRLAQPAETVNFYTTSRPARAGDVLEIYATGLGPVEPPLADGMNSCLPAGVCLADGSNVALRHTTERPRVWIGGVEVAADGVLFSGLAPTLAAVDMVLVKVPAGIAPSAAAEVVIAIGGRESQAGVTIAVE